MPAAHNVHPEFGLLCPTPRLRRKLRVALAGLVCAMLGLVAIWAAHRGESSAVTALRLDASGGAGASTGAVAAGTPRSTAAVATPAENGACGQDIWTYLDATCVLGELRKPRSVRAANDRPRIAASPLGRSAAMAAGALEPALPTARVADGAAGDRSPSRSEPAPADAAAAAVPQPRPRPVAASKQPQRSARSQAAPARARRRRCACVARGPLRRLGRARLLPARRIPGRLFQLLPVTPPPRCYFAARRGAARVPKLRLSMFAAVAIVPPAAQQGDRYA